MKIKSWAQSRQSLRVPGYDYSQEGAYFITLVTRGRECLFGDIRDGQLHMNDAGKIVWDTWNTLPARYPQLELGMATVMPNHFHGIVLVNPVGVVHEPPLVAAIHELPLRSSRAERRRMTLPLVVGYFKMNSAKRINLLLDSSGIPVWQRNYYEYIIRDDEEHNRIYNYIEVNAENWEMDEENPFRSG
jgi:REP element-mobilizing transposase RayT